MFAPLTKFISNIVQAESRGKTSFHYAEAPPMLIMRSMINLKPYNHNSPSKKKVPTLTSQNLTRNVKF